MAKFIAKAIKRPGALHRALGVPEGQKIPAKKVKAAAAKGGRVGEEARFAEELEGFKHKRGGMNEREAGKMIGRKMAISRRKKRRRR